LANQKGVGKPIIRREEIVQMKHKFLEEVPRLVIERWEVGMNISEFFGGFFKIEILKPSQFLSATEGGVDYLK